MRTCPNCGNHNEDMFNFCGSCGNRVANVCPGCHFENLLTQPFCGGCGKQLFQEQLFEKKAADSSAPQKKPLHAVTMSTSAEALPSVQIPSEAVQTRPLPATETVVKERPVPETASKPAPPKPPAAQPPTMDASPSLNPQDVVAPTYAPPTPERTTYANPVLAKEHDLEPFPYRPPVFGQHRSIRQAVIGHEQVQSNLTHDFKTFVSQARPTGQVIILSASDGLGKSNLIQSARSAADPVDPSTSDQKLLWFGAQHYRCFSPNRIMLQGWVEFLQNLIGLTFEGNAKDTVHQQIREFIQSLYQNQPVHPGLENFLLDLFGVHAPKPLDTDNLTHTNEFTGMMLEILKRMSAIRPLAIMLEDIQFADIASLDVLSQLLQNRILQQAPIMLVITHSRDFYLTGPLEQALQQVPYKEYVIADLTDAQVEQFLNAGPLGGQVTTFPVPILTALLESGHGLPLYLEELLRLFYLHEIVALDPNTNKFIAGDVQKLQQLRIPNSLPDILEARMAAFSPKSRYILQLASILGERFSIQMLLSLSQDTEEDFQGTLNELFNQGLLIPDTGGTGRFRHGLIWRAVYNQIEPELKVQLHQLVSQTLENDFNQTMTVNLCLMAHHAEQGQLLNRALSYWEYAGVQMAMIGQLTATTHAMFRALQLIHLLQTQVLVVEQKEALAHQEEQLYLKLGMFNSEYNPDLAIILLSRVIHRRKDISDNGGLLEAFGFLSRCYEHRGDIAMALASVDESLSLISKVQYPLEYAALLTTKVGYLYQLGKLSEARKWLEQDIIPIFSQQSLVDEPDYFKTYLNARLFLAEIDTWQCQGKSLEQFDQCMMLAREKHLDGLAITIQIGKMHTYLKQGDYQRCDQEADQLLAQIESLDEPDWFLAQWGLLAMEYHINVGDWDSARQLMLTVVSRAESVHDLHTSIMAQLYGAYIAFHMGQGDKARTLMEQAIATSGQYQFSLCLLQGWQYLTEILLAQGDNTLASQVAQQGLALAGQPDTENLWFEYWFTCWLAKAQMKQGIIKEAGRRLEKIWPELVATQYTPLIAEAAACIGELYKNLATEAPSEISKQHLMKSIQFFQKSQGLWLDLNNKHQVNRIRTAMPGL